jgi:hypothetical protein
MRVKIETVVGLSTGDDFCNGASWRPTLPVGHYEPIDNNTYRKLCTWSCFRVVRLSLLVPDIP